MTRLGGHVPLAWRNFTASRRRLLMSLAGVMFAVILMFMQMGFRNALYDSTAALILQLDGDLFLVGATRERMFSRVGFPRRRIAQVRRYPQVTAAYPVYESLTVSWRNPQDGNRHTGLRALGFDPDQRIFESPEINAQVQALQQPFTVLFDSKARPVHGQSSPGTTTELNGRTVRIVGTFELGPDFGSDGHVLMSDQNFLRMFPGDRERPKLYRAGLGVINVRPGTNLTALRDTMARDLPPDVDVYTRQGLLDFEISFWKRKSTIDPVFTLGAIVGFVVGLILCYQILFTDLSDQLPQFATLKAMGYANRYLVWVIVKQSVLLACTGFAGGFLLTLFLYQGTSEWTSLPMRMRPPLAGFLFVVTVLMCTIAGLLAVRRILSADPAELF